MENTQIRVMFTIVFGSTYSHTDEKKKKIGRYNLTSVTYDDECLKLVY